MPVPLKNKPSPPPEPTLTETCEFSGDTGVIATRNPNVRTLDELLAYMKVDLTVWEVEKSVLNKWETVMREPAVTLRDAAGKDLIAKGENGSMNTLWSRHSRKPVHEPLFQVKAWLRRKNPLVSAGHRLLEQIKGNAPKLEFPRLKLKRPVKRRSFEVSLMDPHIGLECRPPEADSAWDLDQAGAMLLGALDDLIEKASVFGPFEEVFLPFGNDFVHCDNVEHTTTAGTGQPEAISYHRTYDYAVQVAIDMVKRLRRVAPRVCIYEVPGNHSRVSDFTLSKILWAYFHRDAGVIVDHGASPYKFHRYGVNLIGYEHGHSVKGLRLVGLMANERPDDWQETKNGYREWHLGDQHRKGSSKPSTFEEQGVSIEYIPGLTAPNEWHRLKAYNHQQRGAMAFVWDFTAGPIARFQMNIGHLSNQILK